MWARPCLPAHLPPRAQPLQSQSQAGLWTQDQTLGSRRTPLTQPALSDSLLPWPRATAVPWQEAGEGCAGATGSGARGPLSQEGLEQLPGDCTAGGWDLRWPVEPAPPPGPQALGLFFLLPTMKKEAT